MVSHHMVPIVIELARHYQHKVKGRTSPNMHEQRSQYLVPNRTEFNPQLTAHMPVPSLKSPGCPGSHAYLLHCLSFCAILWWRPAFPKYCMQAPRDLRPEIVHSKRNWTEIDHIESNQSTKSINQFNQINKSNNPSIHPIQPIKSFDQPTNQSFDGSMDQRDQPNQQSNQSIN